MAVVIDTLKKDRPRHPEKAHRADSPALPKPDWIRVRAPGAGAFSETARLVRAGGLHTVCEEASCPNIGEGHLHARLLVLQREDRAAGRARSR